LDPGISNFWNKSVVSSLRTRLPHLHHDDIESEDEDILDGDIGGDVENEYSDDEEPEIEL